MGEPSALSSGPPFVLVVDDEPAVLSLLARGLRWYGFSVLGARDGPQAIELLRRHRGEVGLALVDSCLPGLKGPATVEALRGLEPGLRCCLMSGAEPEGAGCDCTLRKPFSLAQVADTLRRLQAAAGD
jgi:CheY-like chemotaxis protein